jgi:hypothetical protein
VLLAALVACELSIDSVRAWWDRNSLTGSIVANLVVLAVAALIVDEVVARRRRAERAVSVAVQGLIVFGQTRRAYDAVMRIGAEEAHPSGAPEELGSLANMLLTVSPNLFDDPVARRFLEYVQRLSISMFHAATRSPGSARNKLDRAHLEAELSLVKEAMDPLLSRIPTEDRSVLEGPR